MKLALYTMTAALLAAMMWSVMADSADAMAKCEQRHSRSTCIYIMR